MPKPKTIEIQVSMAIDVDGAPNAYGSVDSEVLDNELNAHRGAKRTGAIVGYLTEAAGRTPIGQDPSEPCPGFYISTSPYEDTDNPRRECPRRHVNAAEINYALRATTAQ